LVQAFYGGNETGAGIASLLFGHHCPSSKLPLTFPTKLEDVPSHPFFPGRDGHAVYNEDVFVGYRGMMDKPLIACFGHGLSYTTFSISQPKLGKVELDKAEKTASLSIEVEVKNTGDNYTGAEVVQCYISPPKETPLPRPIRELAAFEKITLKPGESGKVKLSLDRGAFSYFHPSKRLTESAPDGCWVVQPGKYTIHIGTSLMDVKHSQEVEVAEGFHWMGL
jgi:beta-glucosidase